MTHLEITELLRAVTKDVEESISTVNHLISADLNPRIAKYNLVLKLAEEYRFNIAASGIIDKDVYKKWYILELFEIEPLPLTEHITTQVANALLKFEVLPPPASGGDNMLP